MRPNTVTDEIFKTDDDPLYQSDRSGASFSYEAPLSPGNYALNLHFSENVHNDFGQRIFDVFVEGSLAIDDLDIYSESINAFFPGKNSALVVPIPFVSVTDGALSLDLNASVDAAALSAIEIVPLLGPQVLISETDGGTEVTEGGAGDQYSLVLNAAPTDDVVVTISTGAQVTADTVDVVFTPQNYSTPKTVNLVAVDDVAQEGKQSVPIVHAVASSDPAYDGLAPSSQLSVIVNDDDVPPVVFSQTIAATTTAPTTAAWGPDGRLYVGHITGEIKAYTFAPDYGVLAVESIGTLQPLTNNQILGITFSPFDTSDAPTIYVSHSQLFANGGASFPDTELSPYSGQVSRLEGPAFSVVEPLLTGLPVSNHDHGVNGLAFDDQGDLYIAIGGNTNAGIAHGPIGGLPESPLSARRTQSNHHGL